MHVTFKRNNWGIIADNKLHTFGDTVTKCYEILDGATEKKIFATS